MSDTSEAEAGVGEIHVLVRPPREFEVQTSYDIAELYYTLGQLQNMIMMGGLKVGQQEE